MVGKTPRPESARLGRTPKLTPASSKIILGAIRAGMPVKLAALKAGMTEQVVYHWNRLGKKENANPIYSNFLKGYQQAITASYERRLKRIEKHARKDWKADSWWIERMYPELMGNDAKKIKELTALLKSLLKPDEPAAAEGEE